MTTETILTDEQIENARKSSGANCWAVTPGATETFARNVEQAVLQSPQVLALIDALDESNSLLVACAHEDRPWAEIGEQLSMNREALIALGMHAQ